MSKGFLFLEETDDVLDIIMEFPDEMRQNCLKFISQHPDKGCSFMFALPHRGYGIIMKFVKAGDEGIVMMGADTGEEIVEKLELVRESAPADQKHEIQEIVNSARYSFSLIKQEMQKAFEEDAAKTNENAV
jgi:hypothetical protein